MESVAKVGEADAVLDEGGVVLRAGDEGGVRPQQPSVVLHWAPRLNLEPPFSIRAGQMVQETRWV